MNWGYLSEFWDAITQVGDYTIEFFESIGNAVAGAVGNLFDFINHSVSDVFIAIGWLFSNFRNFFSDLLLPIRYIYTLIKEVINNAFIPPLTSANDIWQYPSNVMSVFEAIPYWSTISAVFGICIILLVGFAILRRLTRV